MFVWNLVQSLDESNGNKSYFKKLVSNITFASMWIMSDY